MTAAMTADLAGGGSDSLKPVLSDDAIGCSVAKLQDVADAHCGEFYAPVFTHVWIGAEGNGFAIAPRVIYAKVVRDVVNEFLGNWAAKEMAPWLPFAGQRGGLFMVPHQCCGRFAVEFVLGPPPPRDQTIN